MIIQKGSVRAIFHGQGLSLKPEVIPAIDRQVTKMIEQLAAVNLAKGLKRLKAEDILVMDSLQTPAAALSATNVGKRGTEKEDSKNKQASRGLALAEKAALPDNPSKIKGPCSRCVGIHDRVIRIAHEVEVQINEGAVAIYKEKLRDF